MQSLPEGYGAGAVAPSVLFSGRPFRDILCTALLVLTFVAHIVMGSVIVASQNAAVDSGVWEPSDELLQSQIACLAANPSLGDRRLAEFSGDQGLWSVFGRNPEIPIVTILAVPVVAFVWVYLLSLFAVVFVYITVALQIAVYLTLGVMILRFSGTTEVPIMFFTLAGVYLLLAVVFNKKITRTGEHLKMAGVAIRQTPHVFVAGGILEVLFLAFLGMHWWFMISASRIFELNETTCSLTPASWGYKATVFLTIAMLWIIMFFRGATLLTTATAIARWFFDQEQSVTRYPALHALRWVFTTSSGTLAVGSFITSITEYLLRRATHPLWWTSPGTCCVKCIVVAFNSMILAFSRFSIISHAITGDQFFSSAKNALKTLQNNFVGGYLNDYLGRSVMESASYSISLAFGFASWAWLDSANGWTTLEDVTTVFGSFLLFVVFILAYLYMLKNPLLTIILIVLISGFFDGADEQIFAPLGSLFVASVCCLILNFQGVIVLNSLDTIFFCFAIGRETSSLKVGAGQEQMYQLLEALPEKLPMEEPVVVAMAVEPKVGEVHPVQYVNQPGMEL